MVNWGEDELNVVFSVYLWIGEKLIGGQVYVVLLCQEQLVVDSENEWFVQVLWEGNVCYEVCFGWVFLICVKGCSGDEMLQVLMCWLQYIVDEEVVEVFVQL